MHCCFCRLVCPLITRTLLLLYRNHPPIRVLKRYFPCQVPFFALNVLFSRLTVLFFERPTYMHSYAQFLNRTCKCLGTLPTNNHAFRIAFNSRLIELDFNPSNRALILGHEVQTSENHYSIADKRRLENIKTRIRASEEKAPVPGGPTAYQQTNSEERVFFKETWNKNQTSRG